MEEVKSLLYDAAGQWKEIAAGLGFDEDMIDEIDTNNQTDELCLLHMVEIWVSRLAPSWETLSLVLRDIGRNDLAQKAWSEGIKYIQFRFGGSPCGNSCLTRQILCIL